MLNRIGKYAVKKLFALKEKCPEIIKEVRGHGLLLLLEILMKKHPLILWSVVLHRG
jgi:4-aminobutyrate aminotransferase-like enzyme